MNRSVMSRTVARTHVRWPIVADKLSNCCQPVADLWWGPVARTRGGPSCAAGEVAGTRRYHCVHTSARVVPSAIPLWYHLFMAMNLRLSPDAEAALRREAERSGRSQQEVVREAVSRQLGLSAPNASSDLGALVATGTVRPPRTPHRRAATRLTLPAGTTSADLLDRGDRI